FTGNFGNHANYTGLPGSAHVVVRETDANGPPTLYDLRPSVPCGTATPTPTATRTPTPTPTVAGTATPTPTCVPSGPPGPWTLAAVYPIIVESPAVASNGRRFDDDGVNCRQ